jgi:3-phosphoshikimate 1-carboxyvinyltransferase
MTNLNIGKVSKRLKAKIEITGSKSESNRLLILQQFYPELNIENVSNSDDSKVMQKALSSSEELVNIGHAGTAMRFLTAYFAAKEGRSTILTGSDRMRNRPIKILVDALRSLGADISYVEKEGYPPLRIQGRQLEKSRVEIDGNVSSQYISALLLIGASLPRGLKLHFVGKVTSIPYIKMTLKLLAEIGVEATWEGGVIQVFPKEKVEAKTLVVESDWSSASYYFSYAALSPRSEIELTSYKSDSLQGDAVLKDIYKNLGVASSIKGSTLTLKNTGNINVEALDGLNLVGAPDIAQTIAVTCLGLNIPCYLTGLHTLKIKETDRLVALKNEIEKFGGNVEITEETLKLNPISDLEHGVAVETYDDHRMAMAFAPLALRTELEICEPDVVSKSYPTFWHDFYELTR